jgi:hypothetical protein
METTKQGVVKAIESFDIDKGGYIAFVNLRSDEELEKIEKLIDRFIGQLVSINCQTRYIVEDNRKFPSAIRVYGKLEKKGKQYRVLFNDGCYTYFEITNVMELGTYGSDKTFSNDVTAVIGVRF